MSNFVTFSINDQTYCLDTPGVERIIKLGKISPLISSSEYLEGMLNVQNEIIPAINLKKLFNLSNKEVLTSSSIIVITSGNKKCGIIVDSVDDIIQVDDASVKLLNDNEFVSGIIKLNDNLISILKYTSLILE